MRVKMKAVAKNATAFSIIVMILLLILAVLNHSVQKMKNSDRTREKRAKYMCRPNVT